MNTMQQEFDLVVQHLYKQGRPASASDGFCKYRGENGTMCAVGCRIPDAMYVDSMDDPEVGGRLSLLLEDRTYSFPNEIYTYKDMFLCLQKVHDGCGLEDDGTFDVAQLTSMLSSVAVGNGLDFKEPKL